MQVNREKESQEFFNLMSGLADSIIDAPDAEIEEMIAEDGDETDAIRAVFANAVRLAKKQHLLDARAAYESEVATFQDRSFDIPETSSGKRDLLARILSKFSQPQHLVLTAQYRDFEKLADDDLDGIIKQLLALKDAAGNEDDS